MENFYEMNDNELNNVTGGFIKSEQYDENGMPYISEGRRCPAWTCKCGITSWTQTQEGAYCVGCSNLLKCGNCKKYIMERGVCSEPLNRKK
jgi:bacteriocin-like protein